MIRCHTNADLLNQVITADANFECESSSSNSYILPSINLKNAKSNPGPELHNTNDGSTLSPITLATSNKSDTARPMLSFQHVPDLLTSDKGTRANMINDVSSITERRRNDSASRKKITFEVGRGNNTEQTLQHIFNLKQYTTPQNRQLP